MLHSIPLGILSFSSGGYQVDNSAVFDFASAEHLTRTPTTAGNRRTWTWSGWVKRSGLGNPGGPNTSHDLFGVGAGSRLRFTSGDALRLESPSGNHTFITTQLFRDPHAWYHIVLAFDSTQANERNRRKLYVNGSHVTDFSSTTFTELGQNDEWNINSTSEHQIAKSNLADYFGGYLAEVVLIDGSTLGPTSFGERDDNGVWRPIEVSSSGLFDASNSVVPIATTWTLGSTMSAGGGTLDKSGAGGTSALYARMLEGDFKVTFTAAALNDALFGVFDYTEIGTFNASQDDGFLDGMTNSFWYDEGQTDVNYGSTTVAASKTIAAGSVVTIERSGSTIKITDDGVDVHSFSQTFSGPVGFIAGHRNTGANSLDFNSISFDGVSGAGKNGFYLPFTTSAGLGQDYSGSSSETKVQENTYNSGSEVNDGDMSGSAAGIAYTAIATAKLATVKINSSSRGFTNVTVQVQTDNGSNAPDGTTLTNGEVTGITGSGSGLKTVDFPNGGPELTAGTKYWIVIPSTDLGGGFEWGIQHDVSGSGGALGIIDGTGYQAGRGFGHEVFQLGNIWKPVNSPTQTSDSPTNNHCVWSEVFPKRGGNWTLSEGNRKATYSSSTDCGCPGSIGVSGAGTWYFEITASSSYTLAGIVSSTAIATGDLASSTPGNGFSDLGGVAYGYYANNGYKLGGPSNTYASYGATFANTDVIGVAFDAANGTLTFYKNGSTQGEAFTSIDTSETWFPFVHTWTNEPGVLLNNGQTTFAHTPPTGYVGINTTNLLSASAPAIEDGSAHMQTTLYTGNGLASRDIIQSTQTQANLETGNNETNNGDMSGAAAGIRFICTRTGKCPSIHIRTSTTGMSNVTCQIKEDGGTGQSPSGSVLTDGEKTGVSFSGQGYAIFDFPNGGPELTAGKIYWFLIPSDTGTWGIARDNDNSEGGPGGRISSSDSSFNTGSFGHKIFQVLSSQFQPDFVWGKNRALSSHGHRLFDAVRGVTKVLQSSAADAEATDSNGLTAFNSNGFEVGNGDHLNGSGNGIVAWQWKAGDSNTAVSASGSGDGYINACTHRANQTAGFSIVKYTGANSQISNGQDTKVTHGLGAKPELALIKNIDADDDWMVLSTSTSGFAANSQTGDDAHLHLNTDDSINGSLHTGHFETGSNSTHFEIGNENALNTNGEEYIAYVFRSIPGYSKVGSYKGGANSTDGIYVNLGFRPAWLMLKNYINSGESWYIFDNQRPGYNDENNQLIPNSAAAEGAGNILDLLSNGFKIRANDRAYGGSSATDSYFYLAFAENPFAGTTPATAR